MICGSPNSNRRTPGHASLELSAILPFTSRCSRSDSAWGISYKETFCFTRELVVDRYAMSAFNWGPPFQLVTEEFPSGFLTIPAESGRFFRTLNRPVNATRSAESLSHHRQLSEQPSCSPAARIQIAGFR